MSSESGTTLVKGSVLAKLPLTDAYLAEHEDRLRQRERGKMDGDGWHGYVYPKNLDSHDRPKLGVPRLCERLKVSADLEGGIYLDNVDVNGILPSEDGPSILTLLVLLNSRLVDWVFRRGSVPFRGNYLSANKQFIAPLPIKIPSQAETDTLEMLGERLLADSSAIEQERAGFLRWLQGAVGVRLADLAGVVRLKSYDSQTLDGILAILRQNHARVDVDVSGRAFRELVSKEYEASIERLTPLKQSLAIGEDEADGLVYELYGLATEHRILVDAEYD